MMLQMKKRITYFDLAKGIGIILVVLGHMENIFEWIRIWISSFHMPLFFIISGMLISAKNEIEIEKKAKGILVPYFWFALIYVPIDVFNLYRNKIDLHTFIQNLLDSITFSGISVMWFLPALFIAEVCVLFIISKINTLVLKKNAYRYVIAIFVPLLVSVVSFYIWNGIRPIYDANGNSYVITTALGFIRVILRGLCMSFHVMTGYMMFKLMKLVEDKCTFWKTGYDIALGVIIFVINMGLCMKNGAVDNHFMTLNNLPLYYFCAFLGSMSIILICRGFGSIRFIEFLGKNSLIIMATHLQCYILYMGILIAIAIDRYVTHAKSYIYMFNAVLFTMLIETIVIFVINKFFPFIVGKVSFKNWIQRFKPVK